MEDTIAAIATAYGEGGIGIVRISGNRAGEILDRVFVPKFKKEWMDDEERKLVNNRRFLYGNVVDRESGSAVDEVLAVFMQGPATYTAEDVAEIYCHGSVISLRKTLELVLRSGARLAENGEFTKRAFLNGRLDLSQAEAVIDVIKAKTDKSYENAYNQMEGRLSEKIEDMRSALLDMLVKIAVNLDYPDEDIEEVVYEELRDQLIQVGGKIRDLINTADTGRMIRDGIAVTIAGRPNVGKSSLMNAFLKEARAIVTDIPGTTRDTIEEGLSIKGIPVRLVDTAGIRDTEDQIERIGIEKTKESLAKADLILLMIDGSTSLSGDDRTLMDEIAAGNNSVLIIVNKTDLEQKTEEEEIRKHLADAEILYVSVKRDVGIDALEEKIENLVYGGRVYQSDSDLVSNVRHLDMLKKAEASITEALQMAGREEALDFLEIDIRQAYDNLGFIVGDSISEDIINEIFSRFCLGK